jgi:uncharacterized membrane protein
LSTVGGSGAETAAHFTRRLEAFSDIVFGLSLSQLAVQLGVPRHVEELVQQPQRYSIFFASFAVICAFWLAHHRMFRHFDPNRVDVFLNFVYLAFTALIPFAMQVLTRFGSTTTGFAIYGFCFVGTSLSISLLLFRTLTRPGLHLDEDVALGIYRRALINSGVVAVIALSLLLLRFGASVASMSLWLLLPYAIAVHFLTRKLPRGLVRRQG